MKHDKSLQEQAYFLYQENGAEAVYKFANDLGMDYSYCKPCEAETPNNGGDCLVCGQDFGLSTEQ